MIFDDIHTLHLCYSPQANIQEVCAQPCGDITSAFRSEIHPLKMTCLTLDNRMSIQEKRELAEEPISRRKMYNQRDMKAGADQEGAMMGDL